MMETKADLWAVDADLRVITTNPITRKGDGAAVMGRGCAREAKQRIADLEYHFGHLLREHGNRVMRLAEIKPDGTCALGLFSKDRAGTVLASFPVKRHWKEEAVPELLDRAAGSPSSASSRPTTERGRAPASSGGRPASPYPEKKERTMLKMQLGWEGASSTRCSARTRTKAWTGSFTVPSPTRKTSWARPISPSPRPSMPPGRRRPTHPTSRPPDARAYQQEGRYRTAPPVPQERRSPWLRSP